MTERSEKKARKRVAILTLGCKTNLVESDAIAGALADAGCEITDFDAEADYYIVNTCTVTHVSDRKSRQMLRRAKKKADGAKVICMGCYSQINPEEARSLSPDFIVGNGNKNRVIDYILGDSSSEAGEKNDRTHGSETEYPAACRSTLFHVLDLNDVHEFEPIPEYQISPHTRAFIKIQDGCDRYCTYCIIPYARGRIRSRDRESIRMEAERLVRHGYTEFVLTGIHLASYGRDLSSGETLEDVVELLEKMEGVRRIRLGSLEPRLIDDAWIARMRKCTKLCDHFHLSLQSGSDAVLKRMNRRYTAAEYLSAVEKLRLAWDRPSVTTDIIVGFPGEGEAEFQETLDFVKAVRFSDIHIFPYSERGGTPAVRLDGKVEESVKKGRAHLLEQVRNELREEYLRSFRHCEMEILVEETVGGVAKGYSSNYLFFSVFMPDAKVGQYLRILPEDADSARAKEMRGGESI